MNKFRPAIIPIILFISITGLLWSYQTDIIHISAYPPPTPFVPLSGYPAGTVTPPPPTPDLGNVTLTEQNYLPAFYNDYKWPITRFSVAGLHTRDKVGVEERLSQVVPPALQIDSYVWDTLPNSESTIQMIRSCVYYRQKEAKQVQPHGIVFKE